MEIGSKHEIQPIRRLLIANRGEIVSRILDTATKIGIETVVIYSHQDSLQAYISKATFSFHLEGDSLEETYLNQQKIIAIAKKVKADGIHPGYGFLSENANFAQLTIDNNLIWIGPDPGIMRRMADKTQARKIAQNINIPTVPAFSGTKENLIDTICKEDYPLLLKAAAGGGGRGMRIVRKVEELDQQIDLAAREAKLAFDDDRLFIEKFLEQAKHIEVQILGDKHGNVIHLYERECTVQRRYQKIIEESPAATISPQLRDKLTKSAIDLAKASAYNSAGTVEFLVTPSGAYYFIETNARIQVEHVVTEMVTGLDLVEHQIRIAEGRQLELNQDDIRINGHAIECRICAEDPNQNFIPSPGKLNYFQLPANQVSRVESSLTQGAEITTMYDSLIAKLIVHKSNREKATQAMKKALKKTAFFGIETNTPYLIEILDHPAYIKNIFFTSFISSEHSKLLESLKSKRSNGLKDIALGSFALLEFNSQQEENKKRSGNPWNDIGYWRAISQVSVEVDNISHSIEIASIGAHDIRIHDGLEKMKAKTINAVGNQMEVEVNNRNSLIIWQNNKLGIDISVEGNQFQIINPLKRENKVEGQETGQEGNIQIISAPLPGKLSRIKVKEGQSISEGQTLAIIESMKIENQVLATKSGIILSINASEGSQIKMREKIITLETK